MPKVIGGVVALAVVAGGGYYAWNKLFGEKPVLAPTTTAQGTGAQSTTPPASTTTGQGTTAQGTPGQGTNSQGTSSQGTAKGQGSQSGQTAKTDFTVSQIATGKFSAQADLYDAFGSYLSASKGSQAWFYKFNNDGTYKQLGTVNDNGAGKVQNVAVGDLLNNGTPVMVVSYQDVMYVVRADGTSSKLDMKTSKVLVGDFNADGKNEGLFVLPQPDGHDALQLLQFGVGSDPKELALVKSPAVPPSLMPARVHADGIDLLSSFHRDGKKIVFTLHKFDLTKGLVTVVEYPVEDDDANPAAWYGTGSLSLLDGGAGMALSRSGDKPVVDLYGLNVDGAEDLGGFYLPGGKNHAVLLGKFQGDQSRLMSIDENGVYYIYELK
jgi:hypothetical protein